MKILLILVCSIWTSEVVLDSGQDKNETVLREVNEESNDREISHATGTEGIY